MRMCLRRTSSYTMHNAIFIPGLLDKIWGEYEDIRFVQRDAPDPLHQTHPAYGAIHDLEQAQWVEG